MTHLISSHRRVLCLLATLLLFLPLAGVTVTSASAATVTATGAYATNNNFPVAITIPFATASGTAINNTINYTATAN